MSVSFAQAFTIECAECRTANSLDAWLILDTRERPDLASQAADETLNRFRCSRCGHVGTPPTPLMLYRAGEREPLAFSPSPGIDPDGAQRQANQLVAMLMSRLRTAGRGDELGSAGFQTAPIPDAENTDATPSKPKVVAAADTARDFLKRYHVTRRSGDIDIAVFAADEAVRLGGGDADERAHAQELLGWTLTERYEVTGDADDLERGIGALEAARDVTPEAKFSRARTQFLLGNAYSARYRSKLGRAGDLDEAIAMYRAAAPNLGAPNDAVTCTLNWAGGLIDRYRACRAVDDLDEAIDLLEQVLSRVIEDASTRGLAENNLGTALLDRYKSSKDPSVLDRAVEAQMDAVRDTPVSSPLAVGFLNNLAVAYTLRFETGGAAGDLEGAIDAYRSACTSGEGSPPEARLQAARGWASLASRQRAWKQVLEASTAGFNVLEALDRANTLLRDRQNWHREARGIVSMAAYAFARIGRLEEAVDTIESHWAKHLEERLARDVTDEELKGPGGDLAHRYVSAVKELRVLEAEEAQATLQTTDTASPPNLAALRHRYRDVQIELGNAVEAIRRVDGFERFVMPPAYAEIARAVRPGDTLVYLLVTPVGALALLVGRTRGQSEVRLEELWLDDCTLTELERVLVRPEASTVAGYLPVVSSGKHDHDALDRAITQDLQPLGRLLVAPLAARLRNMDGDRLTLIPGGALKLVPLAGIAYEYDGRTRYLLDDWAVSLVPSARAYVHARTKLRQRESVPPVLTVVANPRPVTGFEPLWFAEDEARAAAVYFEEPRVLPNEKATLKAVTDALPGATHVHFACHGLFASANPHLSLLVLAADVPLLLYNVIYNAALPNARLVVLSACETGVSALDEVPEEWVGFPTGFLLAGVPSVIGSLWKLNDQSTALLMGEFYRLHRSTDSALEPAEALRRAQLWLRDHTPFKSPVHWSAFAHFGA